MPTITLVHHRVEDFDKWRDVYDSDEVRTVQLAGGVSQHHVWRSTEDTQLVVVVHRFDTEADARRFFESGELRDAMEEAGVDGDSLQLQYLDEIASGEF